jgi:hypothetical protein
MDGLERFGLAAVIALVVLLAWAFSLLRHDADPTTTPPRLARASR